MQEQTWKIGLTWDHAAGCPPGISEGPYRAPSSPPLTCKIWSNKTWEHQNCDNYKYRNLPLMQRYSWQLKICHILQKDNNAACNNYLPTFYRETTITIWNTFVVIPSSELFNVPLIRCTESNTSIVWWRITSNITLH